MRILILSIITDEWQFNHDLEYDILLLRNLMVPAGLKVETESVALADVEKVWNNVSDKRRIVFTIP
jgi:hypothetical protein